MKPLLLLITVLFFVGCKENIKIQPYPYIWDIRLKAKDTFLMSCRNLNFLIEHDSLQTNAWADSAHFYIVAMPDTVYIHDTIYRNKSKVIEDNHGNMNIKF